MHSFVPVDLQKFSRTVKIHSGFIKRGVGGNQGCSAVEIIIIVSAVNNCAVIDYAAPVI